MKTGSVLRSVRIGNATVASRVAKVQSHPVILDGFGGKGGFDVL